VDFVIRSLAIGACRDRPWKRGPASRWVEDPPAPAVPHNLADLGAGTQPHKPDRAGPGPQRAGLACSPALDYAGVLSIEIFSLSGPAGHAESMRLAPPNAIIPVTTRSKRHARGQSAVSPSRLRLSVSSSPWPATDSEAAASPDGPNLLGYEEL